MILDKENQLQCLLTLKLLLISTWLSVSGVASATLVEYEKISQSANYYEYQYTITNDGAFDIEAFSIFFEADAYQNLVIISSPVGWDPLVIEPDPFFGDGFVDWYSLGSGIEAGDILDGFMVGFDWIGAEEVPFPSQSFDVYDPITFDSLDSGSTIEMALIPEPSSGLLLFMGLLIHFVPLNRK